MVLLNLDLNCSKNCVSFSFDKITTGTYNFVSVILNSSPVGATIAGRSLLFSAALYIISAKTQFFDQVKMNSTSQLYMVYFNPSKNYLNVSVE